MVPCLLPSNSLQFSLSNLYFLTNRQLKMRSRYLKLWAIIFAISVCWDQFAIVLAKRSGSYSSRGSSRGGGSRGFSSLGTRHPTSRNYGTSNGGGHGRGRWTDRIFGRGSNSRNAAAGGGGNRGVLGGIMGGGHGNRGTNYGGMGSGRKSGGLLGGIGSKLMGRGGGRGGGYKNSMFRNSGVGSRSRSNTFKNMIVGAAAGFLAYKAGKAIIKNVAAPMMWNNRPYYWGSQYYPHHQQPYGQQPYGHGAGSYGAGSGGGYPGENSKTMCRMPIDVNDPVLGQVYMEDNTRPKEIVWSCEYSEDCCGYECCPREY